MYSEEWMFNQGALLEIYHEPSDSSVQFKSFLTQFHDRYEQNWNDEEVFGRNDAHQIFKRTGRTIDLGFMVIAEDIEQAIENQKKLSLLINMQYPMYDANTGTKYVGQYDATAISASPVFRLKFANWIMDASSRVGPKARAKDGGLFGTIRGGVSFSPNLDIGYYHYEDQGQGQIYPKEFEISFQYHALHTHPLGWTKDKKLREGHFPYGEDLGQGNGKERSGVGSQSRNTGKKATPQQQAAAVSVVEGTYVKLGPLESEGGGL